jgi:hypothetical protein
MADTQAAAENSSECDDLLIEEHAAPAVRAQHQQYSDICLRPGVFCFLLALLCFVAIIAYHQPLSFSGVMYRRHWCGLPISEGTNGCLYMHLH